MLTVTNAWNQGGWSGRDHLISDAGLIDMIGRTYRDLASLRRAAARRADARSYPTIEYHDGIRRYRYDGSPSKMVTDLGPLHE